MEFNWPHMLASAAIILLVLAGLKKTQFLEGASRGKRVLLTAVAIFVPLLILNLIWPYSGA